MIRLSAFADEAFSALTDQLGLLRKLGLHWLEIRNVDGKNIAGISSAEARHIRTRLDDSGIGVSAVASPIGKCPVSDPLSVQLESLARVMETASELGTANIRIFSFYAPPEGKIDDYGEMVVERLGRMSEMALSGGMRLLHENEAGIYGHSAENCAELCSRLYSPSFVQVYDPGNFVWGEKIVNNVDTCWPLLERYVGHIHMKDWKLGSQDTGSLPGEGDGCVERLFKVLAASFYDGFVTLEPHMSSGGRFGGSTSPEQFRDALERVKYYLDSNCVAYE